MKNQENIILRTKVKQAVTCLKELNTAFVNSAQKKNLLSDESEESIFLQVALKKIPQLKGVKMIKIHLPHPLIKETSDVCLITGDLDKRDTKADIEPTVLHYKNLLQKHGIKGITEVISLRQLRTEYKSFETKRALLGAYDVFLADNRIAGCLPRLLGKFFFKKRKYPIQIDMKTSNLKNQFDKALSSAIFHLTGDGNTCVVQVAHHGLESKQIVQNVVTAVKTLRKAIPGSLENILGLCLKSSRSKALPIYLSFGNPSAVKLNVGEEERKAVVGELSTLPNKKVKIHPDFTIDVLDESDEESDSESGSEIRNQLRDKKLRNEHKGSEKSSKVVKHKIQPVRQERKFKKVTEDEILTDAGNNTGNGKLSTRTGLGNTNQIQKKRKLNSISLNENITDGLERPIKSRKISSMKTKITEIKSSNFQNKDKIVTGVTKFRVEKQDGNKKKNRQGFVKMIIPKKVDGYDSSQFKVFTPAERETKQSSIRIDSTPLVKAKRPKNTNLKNKINRKKTVAGVSKFSKRNIGSRKGAK